ncbi:MAG: hypothetical protein I8H68_11905 [Flavobacteriia bacterium]|nr:hypothetical protein [Flavobacteriia bacterium]MBH2023687.1 hypothetical protein [Flavobacteriales bacterium]
MANCENGFSFKAVDSDGKDSCMTAYRNQNKIDNSRLAGILLCAVTEAYSWQERNGRSRP